MVKNLYYCKQNYITVISLSICQEYARQIKLVILQIYNFDSSNI